MSTKIFRHGKTALVVAGALGLGATACLAGTQELDDDALENIRHFVVIYQENHSFDNLYGGWEGVNGRNQADAAHTQQVSQSGASFACLLQNDANLTSPLPLAPTCQDTVHGIHSAFANAPFNIDTYIPATANTCPNGTAAGAPGGCTRDLVHRFYQEQYQLDGGKQDRYVTGSDAVGLAMGYYSTQELPIYRYLHADSHPHYAIADNFFQAAFGGSFLNHQWLVAAATPIFAHAPQSGGNDLHSVVDANGMPANSPLYKTTAAVKDASLTAMCADTLPVGVVCGDYAINTTQPFSQPYAPGVIDAKRLPPLPGKTIGDALSEKGVSWAWYSGGWSNAAGNVGEPGWSNGDGPKCADARTSNNATFPYCADKLFQFHHQAFNYFANFGAGTAARKQHLRDETEFLHLAQSSKTECHLPAVSFVKPLGAENEHPGYASVATGNYHLVDLLQAVENGACAQDTMIIVTYDEFGGQWDHVAPPGQGNEHGPHDQWGPGTRIPALVIAPQLHGDFVVDHAAHDTTSILATLEHRYHLAPLGARDAHVTDLSTVFEARAE